jgi:hypothetical protein
MKTYRDITVDIGQYGNGAHEIPIYSYERPAYILWQAVFEGLIESGKTEAQAIEWLQSKSARWALDTDLGNDLRALGRAFGAQQ